MRFLQQTYTVILIYIYIKYVYTTGRHHVQSFFVFFFSGNYGERGIEEFKKLAKAQNVCIAEALAAPSVENDTAYNVIIQTLLKTDSARVIVCFCEGYTARRLMQAMKREPRAHKHFQILAR